VKVEALIVGKDYYVDRRLGMIGTYEKYREETNEIGFKIKGSNFPYLKDRNDGLVYFDAQHNNLLIVTTQLNEQDNIYSKEAD